MAKACDLAEGEEEKICVTMTDHIDVCFSEKALAGKYTIKSKISNREISLTLKATAIGTYN